MREERITALKPRIARSSAFLALLSCFTPVHAQQMQNCVIAGGVNNGSIIQNCIILGPQRLTFRTDIADEIIKRLPPGKTIYFASVGSERNQQIADQYFQYLETHGVHFAGGTRIGVLAPPPDYPINIRDRGDNIQILIDPSVLP